MYKGYRVGVVIPAYNEERFVGDVIETVPEFVDRVYPVDDRSTDGTWAEIRRHARGVNERWDGENGRVVAIRHDRNRGVGAAIKTGYRRAMADGLDIVAVMNGDGQMDPDILDRILDPIARGEADYAKGNRLLSADHWHGMSGWRLFGNFVLTYLTRVASGYWQMTDPQNGYTAISAEALERIDVSSLYDEYGFLNDLLVKLNAHNLRIADVEMRAVYGEETSSIRYQQFIPLLSWLLVRDFLWRLETKYVVGEFEPLILPYLVGVGGVSLILLYLPLVLLRPAIGEASVTTTVAAFVSCLALIGLGMLFDRRHNGGLETRVRK